MIDKIKLARKAEEEFQEALRALPPREKFFRKYGIYPEEAKLNVQENLRMFFINLAVWLAVLIPVSIVILFTV